MTSFTSKSGPGRRCKCCIPSQAKHRPSPSCSVKDPISVRLVNDPISVRLVKDPISVWLVKDPISVRLAGQLAAAFLSIHGQKCSVAIFLSTKNMQ